MQTFPTAAISMEQINRYFSHPRHLQNKEKVAALALSFSNNLFLFYFGRAFPFIYF